MKTELDNISKRQTACCHAQKVSYLWTRLCYYLGIGHDFGYTDFHTNHRIKIDDDIYYHDLNYRTMPLVRFKLCTLFLIILFSGHDSHAQKFLGLYFDSEYYIQNSYYNRSESPDLPIISKMIPTWGHGISGIYQKNIKKNWFYAVKAGLIWGHYQIGINYPLYRFSDYYKPGESFSLTYNTPSFTRFDLQFRLGKILNPNNRLQIIPYIALMPSWYLTDITDYDQEYRYRTDFSGYKIIEIDGQIGGAFPQNSLWERMAFTIPGFSIGLSIDYTLNKLSLLNDRQILVKLDLAYSGTIPITNGGGNPLRIFAFRDDLGIEEKMFNSDRLNRFNVNIGIVIPLKKDSKAIDYNIKY